MNIHLKKYIQKFYKPKSIIFISFHKCATSYFSNRVLKHVAGLKPVDYLQDLYQHEQPAEPVIEKRGYIYGVIRIQEENHPRYSFVQKLFDHPDFKRIKQVYFTRDPRDILVSSYYSFGFSHGISKIADMREYELKKRKIIQNQTLDQYVLGEVGILRNKFLKMYELIKANRNCVHLKYEEMVLDFKNFYMKFSSYVPVDNSIYEQFYINTRPEGAENKTQHKRSGKVWNYKTSLDRDTIKTLNGELKEVLQLFNYQE